MRADSTFSALWGRLVAMAEARPEMRAIQRLNALSDDDLAARGLTRAGEVRRILGSRYIY
jgi:hypothetical protein